MSALQTTHRGTRRTRSWILQALTGSSIALTVAIAATLPACFEPDEDSLLSCEPDDRGCPDGHSCNEVDWCCHPKGGIDEADLYKCSPGGAGIGGSSGTGVTGSGGVGTGVATQGSASTGTSTTGVDMSTTGTDLGTSTGTTTMDSTGSQGSTGAATTGSETTG